MLKNFKKRATTVFRKKKAPDTNTDLLPGFNPIETTTSHNTSRSDNPPFRYTYSTSTNETDPRDLRDTSIVAPAPPSPPAPPLAEVEPIPAEEETQVEDLNTTNTSPPADPFARKYVPFIEATPLRDNMLVNAGVYGKVNPAIMSGFGDDSDDDIWLVDDEESDEEQHQSRHEDEAPPCETAQITLDQDNSDNRSETRSHRSNESPREVPLVLAPPTPQDQVPDAPPPESARPAFAYNRPPLLDDDEFGSLSLTTTVEPSPRPPTPTPVARRGYAPISASILNLSDLDVDVLEPPTTPPKPRAEITQPELDFEPPDPSSSSVHPYVALLEHHDNAMTVAYLRQLDQAGDEIADDIRFGQQYQKAPDTPDVIVTRQRVPASTVTGEVECVVCTESKGVEFFPRFSITATCNHAPSTCLECIQLSIESDLNSKLWTEIRCPECRELLEYADIQRYANKQTFMRYETLALRAAMSEAENFVWCTSACGSGQIHDSGVDQPIVTCLHCRHRFCFHHNVPWHENLTCDEYDQLLADPENFRSRLELENEAWSESQRAQLETDRAMAQNLLADEQAEMQRRDERARQEREQARKAAELVRKIAARRKLEEQKSWEMVNQTTKPCPGCGWAIEKNDGCSHMTCINCKHEFCWGCYTTWSRRHNINCRGIKCHHEFCFECGANHKDIVAGDNTAHKRTCRFHPDNMELD